MGEEFTCNDGQCISIKDHCDKVFDCEDGSDEESCDYFYVDPNNYNKEYPPISKNSGVDVKVHVAIDKLQNIREIDMTFKAKFTLTMEWFDSRLRYKNLLDTELTNLVREEHKSQLWIPPLVFNNTDENIMVTDQTTAVLFINKRGGHTAAPLTSINEDLYYEGSENVLVLKIDYDLTFRCNFHLGDYPFDTQICKIEVLPILHLYAPIIIY